LYQSRLIKEGQSESGRPSDLPPTLDKVRRIIVETVRENEGVGEREVARMLNLPSSTVNRQITRLAEMGVLRLERHGMTIRCYLANGNVSGAPDRVE